MDLILNDVELNIDVLDQNNNSFDIFYHKKNCIFVAVNQITKESYRYRLTKSVEDIIFELQDEILEYRLDKRDKNDCVGIGDIFMYGKHLEQIK